MIIIACSRGEAVEVAAGRRLAGGGCSRQEQSVGSGLHAADAQQQLLQKHLALLQRGGLPNDTVSASG